LTSDVDGGVTLGPRPADNWLNGAIDKPGWPENGLSVARDDRVTGEGGSVCTNSESTCRPIGGAADGLASFSSSAYSSSKRNHNNPPTVTDS